MQAASKLAMWQNFLGSARLGQTMKAFGKKPKFPSLPDPGLSRRLFGIILGHDSAASARLSIHVGNFTIQTGINTFQILGDFLTYMYSYFEVVNQKMFSRMCIRVCYKMSS